MQFDQQEYLVSESDGSVAVCLEKDKNTTRQLVANIMTSEADNTTATGTILTHI